MTFLQNFNLWWFTILEQFDIFTGSFVLMKKRDGHILYKRQYRESTETNIVYCTVAFTDTGLVLAGGDLLPLLFQFIPQEEVNEEIVKQTGATQSLFFDMKCSTVNVVGRV